MEHDVPLSLECWIRPSTTATNPRQQHARRRLEQFARHDLVEVSIECWGDRIDRSTPCASAHGRRVLERLDAFETWARSAKRTLEPYFSTRTIHSELLGATTTVTRPPTIVLAEFWDGRLEHVAPSMDGSRAVDVFERLDAIESAIASGRLDASVEGRSVDSTSDPASDEHVIPAGDATTGDATAEDATTDDVTVEVESKDDSPPEHVDRPLAGR